VLSVEQQSYALTWVPDLLDRKLLERNVFVGLPEQDRSGRISSIERIEEVANASRSPYVLALHLRQTKLPRSIIITNSSTLASALAMFHHSLKCRL
jgi:hypothetical protein